MSSGSIRVDMGVFRWCISAGGESGCATYNTDCDGMALAGLSDHCHEWKALQAMTTMATIFASLQFAILAVHAVKLLKSDNLVRSITVLLGLLSVLCGMVGMSLSIDLESKDSDSIKYNFDASWYLLWVANLLAAGNMFLIYRSKSTSLTANLTTRLL